MGIITEYCGHRHVYRVNDGKYYCPVCRDEHTAKKRNHPEGKPHLVNGRWLCDSDFELVMGYRRKRDRDINRAKQTYADELATLLALVAKS